MFELDTTLPAEIVPAVVAARHLGGQRRRRIPASATRRASTSSASASRSARTAPRTSTTARRPGCSAPSTTMLRMTPRLRCPPRCSPRSATGGSRARSSTPTRDRACCPGIGEPAVHDRRRGRNAAHRRRRIRDRGDHPASGRRQRALPRAGQGAAHRPRDGCRGAHGDGEGVRGGDPALRPGRRRTCSGPGTSRRSARSCARTHRAGSRVSSEPR